MSGAIAGVAALARVDQVAEALQRIEDGTYGTCLKCDDPVDFARLEARPESPFCLDCQDRIDKKLSG